MYFEITERLIPRTLPLFDLSGSYYIEKLYAQSLCLLDLT